ncbi:helix-turn-helix transcriptional regulator [Roseovarius pacificus]|uniref:helix-turn-helix transcriptional regulator n=1 Tax=Roseovarius pacificus TaxID=337701 RepID=UPI004039AD9D
MNRNTPDLIKDRETAEMLNIGVSTLWRYSKEGKIPAPIKIGYLTRWRRADIERWLAEQEAA